MIVGKAESEKGEHAPQQSRTFHRQAIPSFIINVCLGQLETLELAPRVHSHENVDLYAAEQSIGREGPEKKENVGATCIPAPGCVP